MFTAIFRLISKLNSAPWKIAMYAFNKATGNTCKFVSQGSGGFLISGPLKNVIIGKKVGIKSGTYFDASDTITIGSYVHFGGGLKVFTSSHIYEGDYSPYRKSNKFEPVVIEDFSWIGMDVIILPGTRIGRGSIIGAGSLVTKSVPDYEIWGGVPAAKISCRQNIQGFEDNVVEGRVH